MAAKVEEVVIKPHAVEVEQLGPDPGHRALRLAARRDERRLELRPPAVGLGQGAAIDLAVRAERQGRQGNEDGGHHVFRQALRQEALPLLDGRRLLAIRHEVGYQPLRPQPVHPRSHHGLGDSGEEPQGGLNLTQLNAEAADLDLVIESAQVLDGAVLSQLSEVAGPVEARSRLAAPRIGDEVLGGQLRAPQVAAGQRQTADQQLAGGSCRRRA